MHTTAPDPSKVRSRRYLRSNLFKPQARVYQCAQISFLTRLPHDAAGAGQTRAMPLFMVASAAEAKPSAAVNSSVPQWQRVAANLAAGAAAGCSVEAGGRHTASTTITSS